MFSPTPFAARRATPAERLRTPATASCADAPIRRYHQPAGDTRPEVQPEPQPRCVQHLARYATPGVTRTWLQSQEKSLLRELDTLTKGLAHVRQQLANLPA